MFESKYSKVLTVILTIVIIAIVGLLGFLAYNFYQNYIKNNDASDFVDDFQGQVSSDSDGNDNQQGDLSVVKDAEIGDNNGIKTYKGFIVLGTIEIPTTGVKYPVLEKMTKKSIEVAVAKLYGTDLNEPGNVVIVGHNYRNGLFFSNNKKLQNGDKIYITDNDGRKMAYTIYNKFDTTPEDTSFYQRDTAGIPEITLSTCTDDTSARTIIEAKADEGQN